MSRNRRGAARNVVLAAVGACALLAAIGWWITRERADVVHAPVEPAGIAAVETRPAHVELAGSAAQERAVVASEPPVVAEAVEPTVPTDATAREPVLVLVVERGTNTPVAGAEVRWANQSEIGFPPGDPRRPRWMPEPEETLASARRATTDEHGVATIDTRVFQGRVSARRGDSFGWTLAHEVMPRPLRIVIAPDRALVFEVVDADGRPVGGAPVGLRKAKAQTLQGCFWTGTTDELGRATLTALNDYSGAVYACLEILARDAPAIAVDLTNPPTEPLRLVMPACGPVTVDVRDATGSFVTPESIGIGIDAADPADKGRWGDVRFGPESIEDGRATFPFVGVGLRLEAYASNQGRTASRSGPGPAYVGHAVHFDLTTGPPLVTFAGRIVDETGAPLALRWVQVITIVPNGSSSRPTRTDAEGRILQATPTQAGQLFRATVRCTPIGIGAGEGARADLEVEVPDAPALVELGDIVVRTPIRIAAGIVVDDLDEPVADAQLAAEIADASGAWRTDPRYRTTVARDGRFAVHAVEIPERLRIRAARPNFAPAYEIEVIVGDLDARIVLPRASEIAGRVLLDAGVDPSLVEVRVTPVGFVDRPGPEFERRRTKLESDGSFVLRGLPPGRADVSFRARGAKVAAHEIAGVELPVGGRAADGRLDSIDLRGRLGISSPKGGAPKR